MGKLFCIAGILLVGALAFVQPASADGTTDVYQLTGHGYDISFTLPTVVTPTSVAWNGIIDISNVTVNVGGYNPFTEVADIQLGPAGYLWQTNYFALGDKPPLVELIAPGLFTWNADGTVTLNTGTFMLATWYVGQPADVRLTVVDPPVSTPEPTSLALLGVGGLAIAGLRRRKAA